MNWNRTIEWSERAQLRVLAVLLVVLALVPTFPKLTRIAAGLRNANTASFPQAFEVVKSADQFSIGLVGIGGVTSRTEVAFRAILMHNKRRDELSSLLMTGTKAGQLYALLGLKLSGDPAFDKVFPKFASDNADVITQSGCLVKHSTVKAIARAILKGKYN